MLFTPSLCHKLSHLLEPPPPLDRDVFYGRPLKRRVGNLKQTTFPVTDESDICNRNLGISRAPLKRQPGHQLFHESKGLSKKLVHFQLRSDFQKGQRRQNSC